MLFAYAVLYISYPLLLTRKKYSLFIISMVVLGIATFWIYYYEHIYF